MLWAAISMTRTLKAQFSLRSADAVLRVPYLTPRASDLLPSPASVCLACKPQGLSGGGGSLLGSLQNSPNFNPISLCVTSACPMLPTVPFVSVHLHSPCVLCPHVPGSSPRWLSYDIPVAPTCPPVLFMRCLPVMA